MDRGLGRIVDRAYRSFNVFNSTTGSAGVPVCRCAGTIVFIDL